MHSVLSHNMYTPLFEAVDGIRNKVIRGEFTKERALGDQTKTLEDLNNLFLKFQAFFIKEPAEDSYDGCILPLVMSSRMQSTRPILMLWILKQQMVT